MVGLSQVGTVATSLKAHSLATKPGRTAMIDLLDHMV